MNSSVETKYNYDVIRLFTLATVFWGIVGFAAGLFIALQMIFPELNIEPYLSFGRLRPVHTSAVIFAFGGNALFATSYYVGQRPALLQKTGELASMDRDNWYRFLHSGNVGLRHHAGPDVAQL